MAVTHDGRHHLDEIMATCLLRLVVGDRLLVVRSTDPEIIAAADIVYDVGREYDPGALKFDHHQTRDLMADARRPAGYASAGLVWKEFGRGICRALVDRWKDSEGKWERVRKSGVFSFEDQVESLFDKLDADVFAPVDNWDTKAYPFFNKAPKIIPFQVVVACLSFEEAESVTLQYFKSQVEFCLNRAADEITLAEDFMSNGDAELYFTNSGYVAVGAAGQRVEFSAARAVVAKSDIPRGNLAGIISKLRRKNRYALILDDALTVPVKLRMDLIGKPPWDKIEAHPAGRMYFSDDRDVLRQFATELLDHEGVTWAPFHKPHDKKPV